MADELKGTDEQTAQTQDAAMIRTKKDEDGQPAPVTPQQVKNIPTPEAGSIDTGQTAGKDPHQRLHASHEDKAG
jgi:hypothetical protein